MSNMTWFDASFGSQKTGLGTVGVTEYDNTGAIAVARVTAGIVETAGGGYGRLWILNIATATLIWDTGEAVPVFAIESVASLLGEVHTCLDLYPNKINTYADDRSSISNADFTLTKLDIGGGFFTTTRT